MAHHGKAQRLKTGAPEGALVEIQKFQQFSAA